MARLAIIIGCFGLPWALAWSSELADVELFYHYSQKVFFGAVPYLDIPIEYPPLGTAAFLLPRALSGGDPAVYAVLFVVCMAACDSWQKWLLWRRLERRRTVFLLLHTAASCLLYYVFLKRFDALAVLCVTQACLGVEKSPRSLAPWGWLAAGVGIKVFPVVLVPIFWRYVQRAGVTPRRQAVQLAWGTVWTLAPQALAALVAGAAGSYWLAYNHDRGLHVASSYAALDLFAFDGFGRAWPVWYDYGSLQVHTAWADAQALWAPRVTALLLACTWAAFWRARREALLWAGSAAAMLAMVLGNKAFSPQYAGWIIPSTAMAAVLGSGSARRFDVPLALALLVGCGFTALLEPGELLLGTGNVPRQTALVLRTACLLALWGMLLARGVNPWRPTPARGSA